MARRASACKPDYRHCLVSLSRGGADADVVREFDLKTKALRQGRLRPARGQERVAWIDKDSVFVGTDFGPGSMTKSGYPRIVKEWKRGTPLAQREHGLRRQGRRRGGRRLSRPHARLRARLRRSARSTSTTASCSCAAGRQADQDRHARRRRASASHREWLLVQPRTAWTVGGKTYPAGALLATNFEELHGGQARASPCCSSRRDRRRSRLLLDAPSSDPQRARQRRQPARRAHAAAKPAALEARAAGRRAGAQHDRGRRRRSRRVGRLLPDRHRLPDADDAVPARSARATAEKLKHSPAFFDARRTTVSQHYATSKDGTRVPYFVVAPKDLKLGRQQPDAALRLRRLRDLAAARLQRQRRPRLAGAGRRLRRRQHPRRRRVRPALAPGGAQGEPPARLRGLRRGGARTWSRSKITSRQHLGIDGRQQRRPADGQHAHALPGAVRRRSSARCRCST